MWKWGKIYKTQRKKYVTRKSNVCSQQERARESTKRKEHQKITKGQQKKELKTKTNQNKNQKQNITLNPEL